MQGMTPQTERILHLMSTMDCVKEFTLIGGTALSLQINKRLSEDMDFCKWSTNLKKDKPVVDWPDIEKNLKTIGEIKSLDILGFDQVNFILDNTKITFLTKQENLSPVDHPIPVKNNIKSADIEAIGAMKIELILRRAAFRDYYDIYSILKEEVSLKVLILKAIQYSRHKLKTRDILNFLSNGSYYKKDKGFSLLNPHYDVDSKDIEDYIKGIIKKEYV